MSNSPTHPGDKPGDQPYVLDWEGNPTIPPTDNTQVTWGMEYKKRGASADAQIQIVSAPKDPVRCGLNSVRFDLAQGEIANTGSCRAELSAAHDPNFPLDPYEPVGAERWYGFGIYLPNTWIPDQSKEIVTQWHHDSPSGSPPLALLTFKGKWWISERTNWAGNDNTALYDTYISDCTTGRWTDWVVHVVWAAGGAGKTEVWQDGILSSTFPHNGQNAYPGLGNYMKIGIYKWCWDPSSTANCPRPTPPDPKTRTMYHDEVRIAGASGSYAAVAPRANLYRYWNGPGADHFYTTDWNEIGMGSLGWGFEKIAARIHATPVPGTVELLRYWNAPGVDHFYTTDPNEIGGTPSNWKKEKVAGYVYPTQAPGTVPPIRYWNGSGADHFYTTDPNEIGIMPSNWKKERTACYVFPV